MTVIASIGPNLPQDLLIATGSYSGTLPFNPDQACPRAGKWLESKFAPWALPVLEAWADGGYNAFDSVVFSRADDTSHRLYYYVCELQRRELIGGPEAIVFDVAKLDRRSSIERTTDQVRRLSAKLGLTPGQLEAGIVETNQKRGEMKVEPGPRPCLLAGTPPPDRRLHEAIAKAGFSPVGETITEYWSRLGTPVAEGSGDPVAALARQIHAEPIGPRCLADPAKRLAEQISSTGAQAVVLWRIEEDEAEAWHLPAQRDALDASGISYLVMTRRDWRAADGAAAEIGAFLEGVSS
ncbi:MAG TPA: 2-hydroxyacyl-CoA dehydratase family protein [Sphingomonadaceae bacterium]|nr:2-hydroxyacyl-CoA dehydratase family protein [Sphingomonadaceae bacterium]